MFTHIAFFSIVIVTLATPIRPAWGQLPDVRSPLPLVFTKPYTFEIANEDIGAEATEEKGVLTIRLSAKQVPPRKGWGGGCVESSSNMNWTAFRGLAFDLDSTAEVGLDVKFEKEDNAYQAFLLRAARDRVGPGRRPVTPKFKDLPEKDRDVLRAARRLCFVVTVRGWLNAGKSVTLTVSRIRLSQ